MKNIIAAAGIAMLAATNAYAQSMTMSEAIDLASMVGMGVGIGGACRLDPEPLKSSFERMKAAERFSEPEKAALGRAYDQGLAGARLQGLDAAACISARRIWKRQVETLTLSMSAAQQR
jgi:hypothetical protein